MLCHDLRSFHRITALWLCLAIKLECINSSGMLLALLLGKQPPARAQEQAQEKAAKGYQGNGCSGG
jgi:hypothetical protein